MSKIRVEKQLEPLKEGAILQVWDLVDGVLTPGEKFKVSSFTEKCISCGQVIRK